MSLAGGTSLLMFLDAPMVVGDPDGNVIYVNPCFEDRFGTSGASVQGEPLASLFSGGAREEMLASVAKVCEKGETCRFRLREGGAGFLALISPIKSDGDQLGVIILLTDEPLADERVMTFHREMTEPLEEATACLEELIEETGGRRDEVHRGCVDRALLALERARKWSDELQNVLRGRGTKNVDDASFDPVRVAHQVAARVEDDLAQRGVELDVLAPAQLALGRGDASRLESALVHLIRQRAEGAVSGDVFALTCRSAGAGTEASIVFAVVDPPRPGREADANAEPPIFVDTVQALGGRSFVSEDVELGRVTLVQLKPHAAD